MDHSNPQNSPWYETAFGILYPILYAHRDDQSAAKEILQLMDVLGLSNQKIRILDICCGAGRHAAFLKKQGFDVIGFDLSPDLLKKAGQREELQGFLVRADMRELPFDGSFHLALNLFTSFGYFLEDKENERALHEMARALAPGGYLVMDHMNKTWVKKNLVPEDCQEIDGYRITQKRRIQGNRVIKKIKIEKKDQTPVCLEENVRFYTPQEMERLFEACGFRDVMLFGSFDGQKLSGDSKRMICAAQKNKE